MDQPINPMTRTWQQMAEFYGCISLAHVRAGQSTGAYMYARHAAHCAARKLASSSPYCGCSATSTCNDALHSRLN